MKQMLSVSLVLCSAVTVFAQEKKTNEVVTRETTKVTTTTTTVKDAPYDLLGLETFNFLDATTFTEGAVDLRLAGRWIQKKQPLHVLSNNDVDEDDDNQWILTPEIVWGATERYEMAFSVPTYVDGAPREGNYDSYVSGQWRITDLDGDWGAVALGWSVRVPTGEGSNGVDATLRGIVTKDLEDGIRAHLNLWGTSVNTDNYVNARDFQYGGALGFDGPLNEDGSLHWVFDYMYEISHQEGTRAGSTVYYSSRADQTGGEGRNTAELGLQWQINECNKLGFAVQAGLDHAENENPDVGASLTYAYTIGN